MALAYENALALENVSRRRHKIRAQMRRKFGANWKKNSKAVAAFTRALKAAGIFLTPGKAAKYKGRKATKKTGARRKSSEWSRLVKKLGVKKAAAVYRGKGKARTSRKGKARTSRKGSTRKASVWSRLVKKMGVKKASVAYRQTSAWGKGTWRQAKKNGIGRGTLGGLALVNGVGRTLRNGTLHSLGGLALVNSRSRRNPFMGLSALGVVAAGGTLYGVFRYGTPLFEDQVVARLPTFVGDATSKAPYTSVGLATGFVAAPLAAMLLRKAGVSGMLPAFLSRGAAAATAGLVPVAVGALLDFTPVLEWAEKYMPGSQSELDPTMQGLAYEFGAIGYENASYGDGMLYQTAPLSADVSSLGFDQATLGDAAYSGLDFSREEGQALLNGAQSFAQMYGPATRRSKKGEGEASHLAAKPGHRWAWLIKAVGWQKAREIAALPPKKRLSVLKGMRTAALAAYSQQVAISQASSAEVISAATSAPELMPSAGSVMGGASGASGASGPGDFGAALFTR